MHPQEIVLIIDSRVILIPRRAAVLKATARVNLNTMTLVVERDRKLPKMVAKLLANLDPAAQMVQATISVTLAVLLRRMKTYPGIGNTIRAFYRSLDEGDPSPNSGFSGRENVRVLRAIESALRKDPPADQGSRPRESET